MTECVDLVQAEDLDHLSRRRVRRVTYERQDGRLVRSRELRSNVVAGELAEDI